MKIKAKKGNAEKFANTPQNAYLENGDIRGKKVPDHLDRQWYIDTTKERLNQFGVNYV